VGSVKQGFSARFWYLIGATFLGFLGMGTVLPGLAPHVRYQLGGSDQTVGFVIGIFSFTALISRFVSGPLADRRGRKIAFLAGLFSCALAGIAYLLPIGLPGAFLGRIFQGFGEACLYTGAAAWAVEMAGIERSAQALGYLSSGIWGGISAGPVIGHWMGSFERAAMFQTIAALAALAVLSRVPETYEPYDHGGRRRWIPRTLIRPGIAMGLVNVHYPVVAGFLILHLARYGNAGAIAFSSYALVILTSRFFLGGLPDRIHPGITFFTGLLCMAVGLVGIASAPSATIAIASTALLGFGFSFPWASIASTVLRRTPERERGSAVSVLSAFYDLFVGISSFAAGTIAKSFGYSAAFYMAAGSLILAALVGRSVFKPVAGDRVARRVEEYVPIEM
jgi:MFS family permease